MSFDNIRLPTTIDYRSEMGPGYGSFVVPLDSKQDGVSSVKDKPRRKYSFELENKGFDSGYELARFFMCRRGSARSFRLKDHRDFTTASDHIGEPDYDDVTIGTGDGSQCLFQLKKEYNPGTSYESERDIYLPVAGTVRVGVNGSEVTTGWTVSATSGKVVFTTPPTNTHVVTAGCEFDTPARFSKEAGEAFNLAFGEPTVDAVGYVDGSVSVEGLMMVEVFGETILQSDSNPQGGYHHGTRDTSDRSFWAESSRVTAAESDDGTYGFKAAFTSPTIANCVDGLWFYLMNTGSSYTLPVKYSGGSTEFTIPVNTGSEVYIWQIYLYCLNEWGTS